MPHRHTRRLEASSLIAGGLVAYVSWYVWWLVAVRHGQADSGQQSLLATLTGVPTDVAPIFFAWRASTRATLDALTRRAWRLLAIAFCGPAIVSTMWVVYGSTADVSQFPTWIHALNYWHYVFTLCALATFPRSFRPGFDRTTFALDASTVVLSGAVVSWHLVFREVLARSDAGVVMTLYTVGTPTADLVALFGLMAFLLRRPQRESQGAVTMLAVGFLLLLVADSIFVRARVLRLPVRGGWLDAMYAVQGLFWALAGYVQVRRAGQAESEQQQRARAEALERRMRPYSLLPYAAIASVYAVLLLQAHRTERTDAALSAGTDQTGGDMSREPLVELVVGAIVVTAIVAARQLAAQKQNAELVAQRLEREAHFRALVQHASDVILVVDPEGRVLEASPAVSRVLGLVPEHLVGRPLYELVIPEDQALARADITQLASTPRAGTQLPAAPCEWRVRKGSAEVRWLEVLCTNLLDDPSVLGIVVNGRDVTERKALEAELSQLAFHDPLTGLCNRARFHAEVMDALSHGKPAAESAAVRNAVAILFIDLDGFKLVNDRHGHAIGDQVLLVVAERLRAATRGTDTVARLGGDEFAVLLGRLADPADVEIVAHRIVSSVGEPIDIGARDVTVGASVGIASLAPYIGTRLGASLDASLGQTAVRLSTTEAQFAAEALLRAADQAMYTAKRRGGHCYAFSGARSAA